MSVFQKQKKGRNFTFGRQPVPNQTGIQGQITALSEPMQETVYNSDKSAPKVLAFWDAEKTRPKLMVSITLQTTLNDGPDDNGEPDDGLRTIFVTVDYKRGGQLAAIQDAMDAARADDLAVGGELALWFTGYDPESSNPDMPRRLFQARYTPPPAGGGAFQQQPAAQQQAAGGGYVPQPQQGLSPQQYQQAAQSLQQGTHPVQQEYQQPQYNNNGWNAPGLQPVTNNQPQPQQIPYNPGTGEVAPSYQPPQQAAAPPQQQVQVNVDDVRARIAAGQQDGQIMAETGASQEAISALRNLTQPY